MESWPAWWGGLASLYLLFPNELRRTPESQAAPPRPHTTSRGPPLPQTHSAGRATPAHRHTWAARGSPRPGLPPAPRRVWPPTLGGRDESCRPSVVAAGRRRRHRHAPCSRVDQRCRRVLSIREPGRVASAPSAAPHTTLPLPWPTPRPRVTLSPPIVLRHFDIHPSTRRRAQPPGHHAAAHTLGASPRRR